jgi:hypothetical protein
VLTSNGAGAAPTFQDAAAGGSKRNLNIQLNTTNGQAAGSSNPTDSSSINGIECDNAGGSGASSIFKINSSAASSVWSFYDNDPDINFVENYSAGSSTGDGIMWFGDTADTTPPSPTQTTKSMFIMVDTVAGTPTVYAVNADGTSNTNTVLTGITLNQANEWRIVKTSSDIKFYYNGTLKATHTTNLPSGDCVNASWLTCGVDNDTGDSTTRTCEFGYVDVQINHP